MPGLVRQQHDSGIARQREAAERRRAEEEWAEAELERSAEEQAAATGPGADRLAEIDAILDEIDDVLEENAAEFLAGYVQKGGE